MRLVKPSFEILTPVDANSVLRFLELCGRVCYKSECRIDAGTAPKFVGSVIGNQHLSVIEHFNVSVKIICDRGVSHELVRHRLASYSQESTRYCNYGKQGGGVTFVVPEFLRTASGDDPVSVDESGELHVDYYKLDLPSMRWYDAMLSAERAYLDMLRSNWTPQQARSVLPNSTKTEIVMTANLREWRHVFKLRCSSRAHPQMREIMVPLKEAMATAIPVVFNDLDNG